MRVNARLSNRLAAALVALALAFLGLGHNQPAAAPGDPMLAAYLQAGGSLRDLCLPDGGESEHGGLSDCPVCALGKILALTPACGLPRAVGQLVLVQPPAASAQLAARHTPRAPPARGPPTLG